MHSKLGYVSQMYVFLLHITISMIVPIHVPTGLASVLEIPIVYGT